MLIVWDEQALIEADAASKFYQQKQSSLGKRFLDNLEDAVSKIAHHPYTYRQMEVNIRKCKLPHFPMGSYTEYRLIQFKLSRLCIYDKNPEIGTSPTAKKLENTCSTH